MSFGKLLLVFGFVLGLAACDSSEERAEAYYQSGLELLEEGDPDRAIVEFRNALQLEGNHRDARMALANTMRSKGINRGAYREYLRVAEQFSDDLEARIALAEIAVAAGEWDEARRHGERAIELAPEDPAVDVIAVNLAYAAAIEDEDAAARRAEARTAAARLEEETDNNLLRQIVIDSAIRDGEFDRALDDLDTALELDPDNRRFYDIKLGLLAELERAEEIETLLRTMLETFPNDEDLPGVLLRFYAATNDPAKAEAFLREMAEDADTAEARAGALTTIVQLLLQTEGRDAALAELDTLIETEDDATSYRALRAGLLFDGDQRDEGLAEMEALLGADLTPEQEADITVGLARMLILTGDVVGARARVEEVLETSPTQPDALKIKAGWMIESGETDEAISMLRDVLAQDGDDTQALTLTAQAYARNGDDNLTREFLALAFEASNAAPAETLRYTTQLIAEERYLPAEEALMASLRLAPDNLQVLQTLGRLYIVMPDWGRGEQVEEALRALDDPAADQIAAGLQASRLAAQGQMDDAVAFLETYAANAGEDAVAAQVAVIQGRLASGDEDGALAFAEGMVEDAPEDVQRRFALAAIQSALGQYDAALANYRMILDEDPQAEQVWVNMIRTMFAAGDPEGAEAALEEGLAALPEGLNLLWAQAGFNEQRGDIDGAIELYEIIYERAPDSPVAANNLASLIATYRSDEESLERAYSIARRLRGTEIAQFQDTYGWIAYRRGALEEALEYLEPAAQTLTDDPIVQFHLGMVYVGLSRDEDALPVLQRALEVAGPDDTRSQFETARTEVARIQATQTEEAQ